MCFVSLKIDFNQFHFNSIYSYSRTTLGIRFSQILNDDATFNSNVIGLAIMFGYSSIYLRYVSAREKNSVYMKIFIAAVFTVLVLVYSKVRCAVQTIELFF